MKNMRSNLIQSVRLACTLLCIFCSAFVSASEDMIVSLTTQKEIGFKQKPVAHIELKIQKTRDLYIALQDMESGMTQISMVYLKLFLHIRLIN